MIDEWLINDEWKSLLNESVKKIWLGKFDYLSEFID